MLLVLPFYTALVVVSELGLRLRFRNRLFIASRLLINFILLRRDVIIPRYQNRLSLALNLNLDAWCVKRIHYLGNLTRCHRLYLVVYFFLLFLLQCKVVQWQLLVDRPLNTRRFQTSILVASISA